MRCSTSSATVACSGPLRTGPEGWGRRPCSRWPTTWTHQSALAALYVLSALRSGSRERWELERLRELHDLVQTVLSAQDLAGGSAWSVAEQRRRDATAEIAGEPGALERLGHAPRAYVLRTPASTLASHVRLLDPKPATAPRVQVVPQGDRWRLDVAWQDRPGLLAALTSALAGAGITVDEAVLATWPDGAVLDSFVVRAEAPIDVDGLSQAIDAAADQPLASSPSPDASVEVDQGASPWHTVCEVRMEDRPGVLASIAAAFAAAGIEVKAANVTVDDALVVDRFEVTDRAGGKLSADQVDAFRAALRSGSSLRRRRLGRGLTARALT